MRINLIKTILAKIAEEREYIIDGNSLSRRLLDSAMDEFLLAEEKRIKEMRTRSLRQFLKQIRSAFERDQ